MRFFIYAAPAAAVLAVLLLAGSGPGVRLGLWSYGLGLRLFAAALIAGALAALIAAVALAVPRWRLRPKTLVAALVLGLACAVPPFLAIRDARSLPQIHDITTDVDNPPPFAKVLPLRAGAVNPPGYEPHVGEIQRIHYPEVQPLRLAAPPRETFAHALAVAEAMGWEIVARDEGAGRIEAVATTRWFGFKDDVVVRITPAGTGSRVDVRSKSRVGSSDVGANARRIQDYLGRLKLAGGAKMAYSSGIVS